jgi:hypothetical protein
LIALEQIDQLDLLPALFPKLIIPPAVAEEIAPTVELPSWIEVRSLSQPIGLQILTASLGRGESAAISLGLEVGADRLILDERAARRLAQSLGAPVIGTLGILSAAHRRGLIPAIKPLLDGLLAQDFRVATTLYESVLRDAGEL